jgi:hypothetical protein
MIGVITLGLSACYSAPVVVGPSHSSIPFQTVMIFVPPLVPKHYTMVARLDHTGLILNGCVSVGGFKNITIERMNRSILMRDARAAAHLGANGILLIPWKTKPGYHALAVGCSGELVKRAEAIYVRHWNPRLGHILKILIPGTDIPPVKHASSSTNKIR